MKWDSRIQDNHSVQILKAAIPFFDIGIGEPVDMEGLLCAVRPYTGGKERKMLDMILQFFQMQRMMSLLQLMQSVQSMQDTAATAADGVRTAEEGSDGGQDGFSGLGTEDMFQILKTMLPPKQQESLEAVSAMMSLMQVQNGADGSEQDSADCPKQGQANCPEKAETRQAEEIASSLESEKTQAVGKEDWDEYI